MHQHDDAIRSRRQSWIVVGSSRGIGRASAEAMARLGAKVVVSEPQGRRLRSGGRAAFANPAGGGAEVVPCNISHKDEAAALVAETLCIYVVSCPPPCTNRQG
jgi:NAD(P)-dependent dehydrogenase (short-subunit alcohol dehydrogenase family)